MNVFDLPDSPDEPRKAKKPRRQAPSAPSLSGKLKVATAPSSGRVPQVSEKKAAVKTELPDGSYKKRKGWRPPWGQLSGRDPTAPNSLHPRQAKNDSAGEVVPGTLISRFSHTPASDAARHKRSSSSSESRVSTPRSAPPKQPAMASASITDPHEQAGRPSLVDSTEDEQVVRRRRLKTATGQDIGTSVQLDSLNVLAEAALERAGDTSASGTSDVANGKPSTPETGIAVPAVCLEDNSPTSHDAAYPADTTMAVDANGVADDEPVAEHEEQREDVQQDGHNTASDDEAELQQPQQCEQLQQPRSVQEPKELDGDGAEAGPSDCIRTVVKVESVTDNKKDGPNKPKRTSSKKPPAATARLTLPSKLPVDNHLLLQVNDPQIKLVGDDGCIGYISVPHAADEDENQDEEQLKQRRSTNIEGRPQKPPHDMKIDLMGYEFGVDFVSCPELLIVEVCGDEIKVKTSCSSLGVMTLERDYLGEMPALERSRADGANDGSQGSNVSSDVHSSKVKGRRKGAVGNRGRNRKGGSKKSKGARGTGKAKAASSRGAAPKGGRGRKCATRKGPERVSLSKLYKDGVNAEGTDDSDGQSPNEYDAMSEAESDND